MSIGGTFILGSILLSVLASQGEAQELRFDQISSKHGLIQNSVSCIEQDRQGFLWFGTWGGVCRYDGYRFRNFQFDPDDTTSLSDNWTFSIKRDSHDHLWVCTREGLSRFDPATERFERFHHDPADPRSIPSDVATAVVEDSYGHVWIGTFNGLVRWSPKRKGFDRFLIDASRPSDITRNRVNELLIDHAGVLWIGTPEGVWRLPIAQLAEATSGAHLPFARFLYSCSDSVLLNSNGVSALRESRDGALWVGTYFGLVRIDRDRLSSKSFRHRAGDPHSLSHDQVSTIFEDRSGIIWVGTWGGGINRFRETTNDFVSTRQSDAYEHSLSDDFVSTMFQDRGGILWVGTRRGLNKAHRNPRAVIEYRHNPASPMSLSSNDVWSVLKDRQGDLWAGSYWAGLNRIRAREGICTVYKHREGDLKSLPSDMVFSIHEARDGTLWIGSGGGLARYDRGTDTFARIAVLPGELVAIEEDHDGSLWLASHGRGLYHYVPASGSIVHYPHRPNDNRSLSDSRVLSLAIDTEGVLWVGTAVGLNRFDRESESFTVFRAHQGSPGTLSHNVVLCIHQDAAGVLWVGTDGGGLNMYLRESGTFRHYTERDGLNASVITSILEDRQGSLWIGTIRGISRFITSQNRFEQLDVHEGLNLLECNRSAACMSASGELVFGGVEGVQVYRPSAFTSNRNIPTVVFTGLAVMNRPVAPGDKNNILRYPINVTDEVTLSYDQNTVTLDFSALDYAASRKNSYACKLEGFDEDWIPLGTKNTVTYTKLDPGEYRFVVRGANNDGVWNMQGAALRIVITPPFWKTRWAIGFYIFMGLAAFVAIRRYEIQRLRLKDELRIRQMQNEQYAEVTRLKDHFFANISHEFRTPLTLILGPIERLLERSHDEDERETFSMIKRNATRLLNLINMILDLTRLESHRVVLHPQVVNLSAVVRRSVALFESHAQSRGIELVIDPLPESLAAMLDHDMMEQALSNLLSNACKYTPSGGRISVATSLCDTPDTALPGWIEICVSDTGAGIPAEQIPHIFERYYRVEQTEFSDIIGSGIGLALVRER